MKKIYASPDIMISVLNIQDMITTSSGVEKKDPYEDDVVWDTTRS